MNIRTLAILSAALVTPATALAQWETMLSDTSQPAATADSTQPDLRVVSDLSGVWMPDAEPLPAGIRTVEGDQPFPRHMLNIAAGMRPEDVPLLPWAAETFSQRLRQGGRISPMALCKPTGVPWINSMPLPYKIVQTPTLIMILYEADTVFRQIFLDGRRPVEDAAPRWMGYSTGRWEGDELVVDTVGLTDQSWLDGMGHPHSDRLHVMERFHRRDATHLDIEVTLDDPEAFTRPFTYTITTTAAPGDDLLEYFCNENEKSSSNYD
jgi:hypothetical protein